jgi:hypothetical protein
VENVEAWVDGDHLFLKVNLTANLGYTRGNRNILIASSRGNQAVPSTDGRLRAERWNLNVIRSKTAEERLKRQTTWHLPGQDPFEDA